MELSSPVGNVLENIDLAPRNLKLCSRSDSWGLGNGNTAQSRHPAYGVQDRREGL